MATLANQSVSFHATPFGVDMPQRPRGSYISARTLAALANFSGESQEWHVIGSNGVTVSKPLANIFRFRLEISNPGYQNLKEWRGCYALVDNKI